MDTEMIDAPSAPPPPSSSGRPQSSVANAIHAYRPVKLFRQDASPFLNSLDFDSTGSYVVTCNSAETLHVYDTTEGTQHKECFSKKYGAHLGRFTHNSTDVLFASTKVDDSIRYLSTHTQSFHRYFKGHTAQVTSLTMSPADDSFLSSSLDGSVRIWDIKSDRAVGILNLTTPYLSTYDPSASVIAIASPSASEILLYDRRQFDKKPFSTIDVSPFEQAYQPTSSSSNATNANSNLANTASTWTSLTFSNDGAHLLLTTSGNGHFLINSFHSSLTAYLSRGARSCRLAPGQDGSSASSSQKALGQGDACFSPDARWVVSGMAGEGLVAWDTAGWRMGENAVTGKWQEAGVQKPVVQLPCKGRGAVVGWDPKWHMLASGEREVVMWMPERGLMEGTEDEEAEGS